MKYLISLAVMLFLFLSVVGAAIDFNNLNVYVDYYNNEIDRAPSVLKSMVGDENLNIIVLMNNGSTSTYGFEIKNAKIIRYSPTGLDSSTIDVQATEGAINDVLKANDPIAAYQEAEREGQMKITGKTFKTNIKINAVLSSGGIIKSFLGNLMAGDQTLPSALTKA